MEAASAENVECHPANGPLAANSLVFHLKYVPKFYDRLNFETWLFGETLFTTTTTATTTTTTTTAGTTVTTVTTTGPSVALFRFLIFDGFRICSLNCALNMPHENNPVKIELRKNE